jgi:Tfp pilus assembly protein PilP
MLGCLLGANILVLAGCEEPPPLPSPPEKVEREAPPPPKEEEVIEATPTPAYNYDAAGRREPFKTLVQEAIPQVEDLVITPPPEEITSPLQQFDLKQIEVVGIILGGFGDFARVKAPDGESYTVNVGTLMGLHRGKVIAISENAIQVKETMEYESGKVEDVETLLYLDPEEEEK